MKAVGYISEKFLNLATGSTIEISSVYCFINIGSYFKDFRGTRPNLVHHTLIDSQTFQFLLVQANLYDGPLYARLLVMTDFMLGPSPLHIKYVSYVYDRPIVLVPLSLSYASSPV